MALRKVHLSRLSPTMWPVRGRYPRQPQYLSTSIPMAPGFAGMGNYEGNVQQVEPRGMPLWSDLHRMGAAGSLSRVGTFGPAAFGTNGETNGNGLMARVRPMMPLIIAMGVGAGLIWLMGR